MKLDYKIYAREYKVAREELERKVWTMKKFFDNISRRNHFARSHSSLIFPAEFPPIVFFRAIRVPCRANFRKLIIAHYGILALISTESPGYLFDIRTSRLRKGKGRSAISLSRAREPKGSANEGVGSAES